MKQKQCLLKDVLGYFVADQQFVSRLSFYRIRLNLGGSLHYDNNFKAALPQGGAVLFCR
ncbi:MAG: hypothetical protein J5651_09470 [Salinivirgaceae bacterium]|nr:hypothetical protein [Salinivirgaceae bacterium]